MPSRIHFAPATETQDSLDVNETYDELAEALKRDRWVNVTRRGHDERRMVNTQAVTYLEEIPERRPAVNFA